jgi:hypothetical protein
MDIYHPAIIKIDNNFIIMFNQLESNLIKETNLRQLKHSKLKPKQWARLIIPKIILEYLYQKNLKNPFCFLYLKLYFLF